MSPSFVPNSLTLPPITSNPTLVWFYSIVCPPKNSCKQPNNYFLPLFPMISNYLDVHCFSCNELNTLTRVLGSLERCLNVAMVIENHSKVLWERRWSSGLRYTPGNIGLSAVFGREQTVNKGAHARFRFFGAVKPWKANSTVTSRRINLDLAVRLSIQVEIWPTFSPGKPSCVTFMLRSREESVRVFSTTRLSRKLASRPLSVAIV